MPQARQQRSGREGLPRAHPTAARPIPLAVCPIPLACVPNPTCVCAQSRLRVCPIPLACVPNPTCAGRAASGPSNGCAPCAFLASSNVAPTTLSGASSRSDTCGRACTRLTGLDWLRKPRSLCRPPRSHFSIRRRPSQSIQRSHTAHCCGCGESCARQASLFSRCTGFCHGFAQCLRVQPERALTLLTPSASLRVALGTRSASSPSARSFHSRRAGLRVALVHFEYADMKPVPAPRRVPVGFRAELSADALRSCSRRRMKRQSACGGGGGGGGVRRRRHAQCECAVRSVAFGLGGRNGCGRTAAQWHRIGTKRRDRAVGSRD